MASGGNRESWDIMLDRYLKEENAQEKRKMRLGLCKKLLIQEYLVTLWWLFSPSLAYISDPEVLSYFLNLAQNETIVRSQDYFSVLTYISSNPKGTKFSDGTEKPRAKSAKLSTLYFFQLQSVFVHILDPKSKLTSDRRNLSPGREESS